MEINYDDDDDEIAETYSRRLVLRICGLWVGSPHTVVATARHVNKVSIVRIKANELRPKTSKVKVKVKAQATGAIQGHFTIQVSLYQGSIL